MTFEFESEVDRQTYAEWHVQLIEGLFGHLIDPHWELYNETHIHRRDHNGGSDQGQCTAWPSPPYQSPIWHIIVKNTGARRFLEVGTGIGYTAVLMAEAGGSTCQVDTVESDTSHADIAEHRVDQSGLSSRINVLRGDANTVLSRLTEPYDVVFLDAGVPGTEQLANRLTTPGGVGAHVKGLTRAPLMDLMLQLRASLSKADIPAEAVLADGRRRYEDIVVRAVTQRMAR